MTFIEDIKEGETISSIYLVKTKRQLQTKAGKSYEDITLQDKTGNLNGKIWDPNSGAIADFDEMDFIEVFGQANMYNGGMQLNVRRVRKVFPDEYNIADYMPSSDKDEETMYNELLSYIDGIKNEYYKKALKYYFVENKEFIASFRSHSAAKTVHHGFAGGLLEHTLAVVRISDFFANTYDFLNRDLLLTGAITHDIGKTRELSDFPSNDYTDEGNLIGHIVIGVEMIDEAVRSIPDFPVVLANEWKHLILAHHGELEFGSPKRPSLAEAFALNFADVADSKLQTLKELFKEKKGEGWLGYQRLFDSNIRRTSEE
ncbi:MAG: HD domain-containing protein [Lachnospiraceae bacterium]|jgi:3'-5' exoribonuclease|nr:HD domain-containing protein [Lachnospiraceae bacterium]